jgi:hypothetical protein
MNYNYKIPLIGKTQKDIDDSIIKYIIKKQKKIAKYKIKINKLNNTYIIFANFLSYYFNANLYTCDNEIDIYYDTDAPDLLISIAKAFIQTEINENFK